jgi:CRISPR-associated exonuclease Cas4
METTAPSITITQVLEHLFCPRFTYFEHVLAIPERQEKRWKVQKGREVHLERQKVNKSYLRKKLQVVKREFDVPLASDELRVRGVADEVLTFEDGSMGQFDYKFAKAPRKTYQTQRLQCVLYGMLIEKVYNCEVYRGYLCYTRENYKIVEVPITGRARSAAMESVNEVIDIIQNGFLPRATRQQQRCVDCCYQKICIR